VAERPDFSEAMDEFMKDKQRVEEEQEEVEEEEEDLGEKEQRTEDAQEAEEKEISDAEDRGNPAEIEDAEKKMEKILDFLKKEERELDDIEKKLEDELKAEADEINIEERMESSIEKDFKKAVQELEDVLTTLKDRQKTKEGINKRKLFQETEDALEEIRYSAEAFRRVLKLENNLVLQLEETKKEEWNLEELANRLENELGIDKKEIKQLIRDSEKLQIREDVEEAKKEAQELSQLIQHTQDEEAEIKNIEEELDKEIEELGKIIGEDDKILKEMKACRHLLEELEEVMGKEKGIIAFGGNSRQAKKVLKDVETTDNKLKSMLDDYEDFVNEIGEKYDRLVGKSSSAMKRLLFSLKTWIVIGIGMAILLAFGFIQGNT